MSVLGYVENDSRWLLGKVSAALEARALGLEPSAELRPYYGLGSIPSAAFHCLLAAKRAPHDLTPEARGRCVQLAMGTGDFPKLMADTFERVFLQSIRSAPATFERVSKPVPLKSLRPTQLYTGGDFPPPAEVGEGGEVSRGFTSERSETITPRTFSRIVELSFQALVNDDVGALADLARSAGRRVTDFENALFFSRCLTPNNGLGPVLDDGNTLFHATHGNVASAGALDLGKLGEARALLKNQKTPDGVSLNADAAFLLVAPAKQTAAESIVAGLRDATEPGRRIEVLGDAQLGASTRFYLVADPAAIPTFVHARVGEPRVVAKAEFERMGLSIRLTVDTDFGVGDFRGAVTGAGA